MTNTSSFIFLALENSDTLPKLDLHGAFVSDVDRLVLNFLISEMQLGSNAVQIIYGRGGKEILKKKTREILDANMAEKIIHKKFVKSWKEAEIVNAGARCIVLLEVVHS